MNEKLQDALDRVEESYNTIDKISSDIIGDYLDNVDKIIEEVNGKVETLSLDDLRHYILRLSIQGFTLGDLKERAAVKAGLAGDLKKEKQATEFIKTEGTQGLKEKQSILNSSEEIVVENIYDLVANRLKNKSEQVSTLVKSLTTVLTSKLQEMKLSKETQLGMEECQ